MKFPEIKIGDICISKKGWSYKVIGICDCNECKTTGIPKVDLINMLGEEEVIDHYDFESGFKEWYKVGNTIFKGNVGKLYLRMRLITVKDEIKCLEDNSKNLVEMLEEIENGTI